LMGLVCRDFGEILDLAQARGLHVIEDCAQALGAVYRGRRVGNWGSIGFYSTEQTKVISTQRGGGAATNDETLLQRLREFQSASEFPSTDEIRKLLVNALLSYHLFQDPWRWALCDYYWSRYGADWESSTTDAETRGEKSPLHEKRLPAPLATVALAQLEKIDRLNEQRRHGARHWDQVCDAKGLTRPLVAAASEPVFLRYPILVPADKKNDVTWCVQEFGVRPGYWFAGEWHPVAHAVSHCPNARYAVEHCINLPTLK